MLSTKDAHNVNFRDAKILLNALHIEQACLRDHLVTIYLKPITKFHCSISLSG